MSNLKEDPAKFFKLTHFAVEKAVNSVFWIDSDANILHANEMAVKNYGLSLDEMTKLKLFNLNTEFNEEQWSGLWEKVKDECSLIIESKHKTRQGREFPVECTFNYIEFDGEEYSCTFVQDISRRRKAENDLQEALKKLKERAQSAILESEEKFHKIFDYSNDAIFIINPDTEQILEANPGAAKLLGFSRMELLSMPVSSIHPNEVDKLKAFAHNVFENQHGWTDELSCLTKSGEYLPAEISASVVELEGKKCMLALIRDITERKLAEIELKEINEQLELRVAERTRELFEANESLKEALEKVEQLKNQLQAENFYLQEEIKVEHNFEDIVTNSDSLKNVLRKVEQVASTDATVLILGETGTGKELFARAVHSISSRKDRPLVKVNCAALPANLIESELFGHEKGAFTGAIAKKIGRFELADNGTIFLDEIGDLPLELQSKLLRVLQEGEFERLGNSRTIKINVRVIAATNRNLEEAIANGNFREDLFYRLNVFPLRIPPLRDRLEDIPLLVKSFVQKASAKLGKNIKKIPKPVIDTLGNYTWPGNVRELENVIERAVILTNGSILEMPELPRLKNVSVNSVSEFHSESQRLNDIEREHILNVLSETNWIIGGKKGAALRLGLPETTLRDRMKKLGIKRPS